MMFGKLENSPANSRYRQSTTSLCNSGLPEYKASEQAEEPELRLIAASSTLEPLRGLAREFLPVNKVSRP